ncbi:MAG: DUF4381 domain-containing protein [Candidatus Krumholzibacteriota bacterium]
MTESAASLQNLRDIVEPAPPPLWPPAPGVWVVLVIILAAALTLIVLVRRSRARSAYRRAGLALLANARTVRDVDIILKRVALAAFPRPQIAPLYGEDWAGFLDGSCSRARFASLAASGYGDEASSELRSQARVWILHHRVPRGVVREGGS